MVAPAAPARKPALDPFTRALERALVEGIRPYFLGGDWRVPSAHSTARYTVRVHGDAPDALSCTCKAGARLILCKHVAAVAAYRRAGVQPEPDAAERARMAECAAEVESWF